MAKLYFRHGTMGSAKTLNLLAVAHNYRSQNKKVLILKPRTDTRYGVSTVESRAGLRAEADLVVDRETVLDPKDFVGVDCVLVDEAQFLSKTQVLQLTLVADELDVPVLCYGLRTDFRGEPFEGSQYLLAWADRLEEIKTICHTGRKATFNARLDGTGARVLEGAQIDVGHHYVAMSRKEFGLAEVQGYAPGAAPVSRGDDRAG